MPIECEGIQGFPADWTLPKNPPDDVEKLDTLRYTALGNAVSVPVVQWIAERIKPVLTRMKAADTLEMAPSQNGGQPTTAHFDGAPIAPVAAGRQD
jgi:DNA (cytosine-5)-methyltransferase 1